MKKNVSERTILPWFTWTSCK